MIGGELYGILSSSEKLRILRFIKDDGSIDYSAAVEFLKNLGLEFMVCEYREELKRIRVFMLPKMIECIW